MDKINASGLTPAAAENVASPIYDEAILTIECRKAYYHDLDPKHFIADYIGGMYNGDFHRMYMGEVLAISGTDAYTARP